MMREPVLLTDAATDTHCPYWAMQCGMALVPEQKPQLPGSGMLPEPADLCRWVLANL
jgi:hypothetical protein